MEGSDVGPREIGTKGRHNVKTKRTLTGLTAPCRSGCGKCCISQPVPSPATVPVTVENFIRAESDLYFGNVVKDGGFGKFLHRREPAAIDNQTIIRLNRDTLYSAAVFDLDAGQVTITLPDAGKRFMSMQVINEDHYVPAVVYGAGSCTYSKDHIGTRYVMIAIRTLVDPPTRRMSKRFTSYRMRSRRSRRLPASSKCRIGTKPARRRCVTRYWCWARPFPDSKRMFGTKDQVDPVRHLIGSAMAWGGNPEKDAIYLNVTPGKNDGTTVYRLTVKDVPVDGFWSISVYNAKGYFEPNAENAYTLNNITAKKRRRRLGHRPVRRLRRQDSQLPADHAGLELHRAAVPPTE